MSAYLTIEESQDYGNISLRRDLMAISLLALLMAPWALLGLALYAFNVSFMSADMLMVSLSILVVSLPKLFQLLTPRHH